MSDSERSDCEIRIEHDGLWPMRWGWTVIYSPTSTIRSGFAFSKDRAQRAAARARLSIERDDVDIHV